MEGPTTCGRERYIAICKSNVDSWLLLLLDMVYYIRFLKSPYRELNGHKSSIKVLITLTTDLGDTLYQGDLYLYATVHENGNAKQLAQTRYLWKPHMRVLWVCFDTIPFLPPEQPLTLIISSREGSHENRLDANMPRVFSAQCEVYTQHYLTELKTIERVFQLHTGRLSISEEMGESIARHIW